MHKPQISTTKPGRLLRSKLAIGGATIATTAIVGSAGIAAAQALNMPATGTPAAVAKCKTDFKALGFKNVGQCVAAYQHSIGHGNGYGGGNGNSVNTTANINVKGDNNVIDVAFNYFFGH
jgi:hypothetical protein